jgi:hypothetical protein
MKKFKLHSWIDPQKLVWNNLSKNPNAIELLKEHPENNRSTNKKMKTPVKDGLLILLKAIEYSEYIDDLNRRHRAKEFSLTVLNFACPGTQ